MPTVSGEVELDFDLSDYEDEIRTEYCYCDNCLIDETWSLKADLKDYIEEMYKTLGYEVICYSAKTKKNIDLIERVIKNRKTIFTGQTGVGKSKLINALVGSERQSEGETSKALGRGKHTTRVVEYIYLDEDTWIGDTPGFSSIDFEIIRISKEELATSFPGFEKYLGSCKFRGCLHDKEPDCKIREAIQKGEILQEHYDTYIEILHEVMNRKERY